MTDPKPLETDTRERYQGQLIADWLGDKEGPEVVQIVGNIPFPASDVREEEGQTKLVGLPVVTGYQEPLPGTKTPPRATVELPLVELNDSKLTRVLVEKFQGAVPVIRQLLEDFKKAIQKGPKEVDKFILEKLDEGSLQVSDITTAEARQYLAEYALYFPEEETE